MVSIPSAEPSAPNPAELQATIGSLKELGNNRKDYQNRLDEAGKALIATLASVAQIEDSLKGFKTDNTRGPLRQASIVVAELIESMVRQTSNSQNKPERSPNGLQLITEARSLAEEIATADSHEVVMKLHRLAENLIQYIASYNGRAAETIEDTIKISANELDIQRTLRTEREKVMTTSRWMASLLAVVAGICSNAVSKEKAAAKPEGEVAAEEARADLTATLK